MIDALSSATQPSSDATRAASNLGSQYEQFLTLLTAQIRHQDPLEPMDSSKFVSQLAQLSQVEQSVATNRNLENLLEGLTRISAIGDMQLIGRQVTVASDMARLDEGGLHYAFEVEEEADVTVRILSDDGRVVRELDAGRVAPGVRHAVDWDRLDEFGLYVPDETLRMELSARDADGQSVSAAGYADARVEGVRLDPAGAVLELDTGATAYSDVIDAVRMPGPDV